VSSYKSEKHCLQSLTYPIPKAIITGASEEMCQGFRNAALRCCFGKQFPFAVGVGGCVPLMPYLRGETGGVVVGNSGVVTEPSEKKK